MNVGVLYRKLIAAARLCAPSDRVPHAFEERVMAVLRGGLKADPWVFWGRGLWRAAVACAAVALVIGGATATMGGFDTQTPSLAEDLESTLYAVLELQSESW